MLPFDIRHIVVCHVQKKLFTIKNSPVFFGPPCSLMKPVRSSAKKGTFFSYLSDQSGAACLCPVCESLGIVIASPK